MSVVNSSLLLNCLHRPTLRLMETRPAALTGDTTPTEVLPFSIKLLRKAQPLICWWLRSPLHGMLSRDVLLLSYSGRKTGKSYELPLSYAEIGGNIYLCTRTSRWWRNLGDGKVVELHLRGRRVRAASFVLDSASSEALDGFRAFLTRLPRTGEMLYEVGCDAERRPLESDLAREVRRSTVLRLEPLVL